MHIKLFQVCFLDLALIACLDELRALLEVLHMLVSICGL